MKQHARMNDHAADDVLIRRDLILQRDFANCMITPVDGHRASE
jgi:hypothetical protein